ncbi:MAG TPA: serine hydrolase domain-containing protein [Tepidisphaeraceae bacterium]|nr:serine hydrolase domain-containing protein [Tepidisphaeraceae bacterium]
MNRIPTLVALLGLLALSVPSRALAAVPEPKFDQSRLAAVPEQMKACIADHEITGAVTLIATKDKFVQLEAVGEANVAQKTPMRSDALFWIASMTKPVTATAILILQDEGKLSINDPVSKYIPELAELKDSDGKPARITLKHLLTHTSGMVDEAPGDVLRSAKTLADLIPVYARSPLQFEPGSRWKYCQSGINSLGRVVEIVSGKSLPDFFQKRIFQPLGMKDTTFYPTEEQAKRIAMSYRKNGDELTEAPNFLLQSHRVTSRDRYPAANGGLYSTASDYGRFCQTLLNGGTFQGHKILKPETVQMMRTVQTGDLKTGFTPGDAWGLGVCIVVHPQGVTAMLSVGTFGHGGAYGTQAWIDPVKGVIYVLMVQRANFPNSDDSPVRKAFQQAAAAAIE